MNKLQELFYKDARLIERNYKKEKIRTLIYSLVFVSQWKYIGLWLKSLGLNKSPISEQIPWVAYGAIDFIAKILTKESKIFEYGSGGSTIYYSKIAKEVISIEHEKKWYDEVRKTIKSLGIKNCRYVYMKPNKAKDPLHDYYRSYREQENSFEDYVKSISQYPNSHFDFVSVDGRARVQCVREACEKIAPGGYIMLDNSDRKDYFEAFLFLEQRGWKRQDFVGLVGFETVTCQTSIWQKPVQ